MGDNLIENKTFEFALSTIEVYKYLKANKEYVISNQLLRSGTSVGANVTEAIYGQSKRDFLSKMNIALKEINETKYWIRLLIASGYLDGTKNNYLNECNEICRVIHSIVKTTRDSLNNE